MADKMKKPKKRKLPVRGERAKKNMKKRGGKGGNKKGK